MKTVLRKKDIFNFLEKHGILYGDTLFLHGNAMALAQVYGENKSKKVVNFWNAIKDFLGSKGTIIVPTFTYSATKKECFDVLNTPSAIGQFSEDFRCLHFNNRTLHTIFSVSYYGYYSQEISETDSKTCFGKKSIFDFIKKINARLISIGCSYNEFTFTHYLEEDFGVSYRYFKDFKSTYIQNAQLKSVTTNYFVRSLENSYSTKLNLIKLKNVLLDKKLFIEHSFGRVSGYSCLAKNFYKYGVNLLKKDEFALVKS